MIERCKCDGSLEPDAQLLPCLYFPDLVLNHDHPQKYLVSLQGVELSACGHKGYRSFSSLETKTCWCTTLYLFLFLAAVHSESDRFHATPWHLILVCLPQKALCARAVAQKADIVSTVSVVIKATQITPHPLDT